MPAKYVAQHPMDQNFATIIQKDEPERYIAQRPMDSRVNVLSFVSNVQPQCAFTTFQNWRLIVRLGLGLPGLVSFITGLRHEIPLKFI